MNFNHNIYGKETCLYLSFHLKQCINALSSLWWYVVVSYYTENYNVDWNTTLKHLDLHWVMHLEWNPLDGSEGPNLISYKKKYFGLLIYLPLFWQWHYFGPF